MVNLKRRSPKSEIVGAIPTTTELGEFPTILPTISNELHDSKNIKSN